MKTKKRFDVFLQLQFNNVFTDVLSNIDILEIYEVLQIHNKI